MKTLLDLALQPSALALGKDHSRAQFVADLDRQRTLQQSIRGQRETEERAAFDARVRAGDKGRGGQPLRFNVSRPHEYMLQAIMRDAALAEYDRKAAVFRAREGMDA